MEAAPLYTDVARAPEGGEAWWLTTSDGVRIRAATWPAATGSAAKGTVLLFPGRTEYIEKYGPAAQEYTQAGFAFLTIDWRGQGLSDHALADPLLGHVGNFSEFQLDIAAVVNLAEWLELPKPWFLASHSMGGCIGLRALHNGLDVAAASFSAPMWGIQLSDSDRRLGWVSSIIGTALGQGGKLVPNATLEHELLTADVENNLLTHDPEIWDFMKNQIVTHPDLTLGGVTLGWLRAALLEDWRLSRMAPPSVPALAFLGKEEGIVDPAPIHALMEKWPGGKLELVDGARHELMMERPEIRARVFEGSIALFESHAAR
jgi:lysophospholipase